MIEGLKAKYKSFASILGAVLSLMCCDVLTTTLLFHSFVNMKYYPEIGMYRISQNEISHESFTENFTVNFTLPFTVSLKVSLKLSVEF